MTLEKHICYEALKTRDARFDGQFFTGVKTTGIFCRPICPAQTPLMQNCDFYETADAAMAAGFRPCLRCRPESAPQSAAWDGTRAVVNRAVRLINQGALDGDDSLEDFANRLGIGERQLRRLFHQHLGLSPLKVAQTKRLMFAKKLLKETSLPITDIAFSSGFKSVRRFNDAFKTAFAFNPSQERKKISKNSDGQRTVLRLSYRPPFDWNGLLAFFKMRELSPMEKVEDDIYHRVVQFDDSIGKIHVQHATDAHQLTLSIEGLGIHHLRPCVEKVRRLFDLDCDANAIHQHLVSDPFLSDEVLKNPGLRLPGAWSAFEITLRAIVGQQITVKAAQTILTRILERVGLQTAYGKIFPEPDVFKDANLDGLGLTGKRIDVIKNIATNWQELDQGKPIDEQIKDLTAIKGIGPWTANYIVMRCLSHPDTFPVKDIALLRKFQSANLGQTHEDVTSYFENFRPWRAYAALYIWQMETPE